ncbi:hypothetical protein ACFLYY_00430 [Patescibacteria group bacterium]
MKSKGFTIIEVLFAAMIITMGVIGAVNYVPQIIAGTTVNSSKFVASYLTQEGFEIVRNIRDGNLLEDAVWNEGLDGCQEGCTGDYTVLGVEDPHLNTSGERPLDAKLKIDSVLGYNYNIGNESKFEREIIIISEGVDTLNISITVSWEEKGIPYQFSAQTKLYSWK